MGTERPITIVVEKCEGVYVAYVTGVEGIVVAEGATREEALREARSALAFHLETFGLANG